MNMKGHNGRCPCRACYIIGVQISAEGNKNHTYYVPLSRGPPRISYDATNLPLRTHAQFLADAHRVETAPTTAEANSLATECGVKGTPILSALSSLEFPTSFPIDFMHLIWENIVKNLILLWTKNFPALAHENSQPYHIKKTVWDAIGEATAAAGSSIPSAFGSRVPNIAKNRGDFSAEAYSIWTLFLGPVLLWKFLKKPYYDHFVDLVTLLTVCMRFELTPTDVRFIRDGFVKWVQRYEELYYRSDTHRLPVCTINVHSLLHIADSIEQCGPVWAYWCFAVERFCGSLLRTIRNRRFPFACLDRRIRDIAQLDQIKVRYNLSKILDLSLRGQIKDRGTCINNCKSGWLLAVSRFLRSNQII
ncbi:hypothetical protein BOTBODRAFT_163812 [Botryobasidium botryosum FD-172 SS1]|uniref:Uncharacterized protein n=1 Tax=Botryobasidium botryosum (strain FD-172 SS1) TaxID=930990 RepID=A0A067M713_BOTB1|nr:hypothetical protein BOTBODRAFT_163812 [Botryobasidium botryosum FD-172 SS1]